MTRFKSVSHYALRLRKLRQEKLHILQSHEILLAWSSGEVRDGRGLRHEWMRRDSSTGFWLRTLNRPRERRESRWKDNIKIDLKETG